MVYGDKRIFLNKKSNTRNFNKCLRGKMYFIIMSTKTIENESYTNVFPHLGS